MKVTVLGSGSAGNAVAVCLDDELLLVDAGFSAKELQRRLNSAGLGDQPVAGVLLSHEHGDHVKGARVFSSRRDNAPAFANSLTAERLMTSGKAPEALYIFSNGMPFQVGRFTVEAFSICHDAIDPVGFIISSSAGKIAVATDVGYLGKMVPRKLHNANIIVLESNHDPELVRRSSRPPRVQQRIMGRRGHLSNADAMAALPDIVGPATRHLVLAHLSEDCNCPKLAAELATRSLAELGRADVSVSVALQHDVMPALHANG
jgi:phosphoribosyl 1,2-cyclic phosphodiesterase